MNDYVYTDMDGLLDIAHDNYFDLEECVFDQSLQEFRLNIGYSGRGPYIDKLLLIKNITDVMIEDRAQIQVQAINEIEVSQSSIRITCDVPVEINLRSDNAPQIFILQHPQSPYRRPGRRR